MEELYTFKVRTRQDFAKFLDLLSKDYVENPATWENKTVPELLEAMSRYSEDIDGYYHNTKQNIDADKPDWGTFAHIFLGAKIYE
ncbi:MAG TPA: hypothetical protein VIM89_22230 [Mucilaginibacter sp.]